MSQTIDENSKNDVTAQQTSSISRSNPIKTSMLRPSALQTSLAATSSSAPVVPKASLLRPAAFQVGSSSDEATTTTSSTSSTPSTSSNPFQSMVTNSPDENEAQPKQSENGSDDRMEEKSRNGMQKSNLFISTKTSIPTNADNSGFVFGQNVHERVTGESVQTECTSSQSSCSSSQLFAIAGSSSAADTSNDPPIEASVECLNEVARVYEESRAQKRKYEEVETFTGEEDERNVLDVNSKLFAFVASNWEERGPGNLRVNDSKDKNKSSRVVFRTSGNLRVLLNTKIWPGMVVERPSQKSLRLTAIDSAGQIKIFLAMARPDDILNLYTELNKRIDLEKSRSVAALRARCSVESTIISTTTIVDDDDDDEDDDDNDGAKAGTNDVEDYDDSNDADSSIPNKKVAVDASASSSSATVAATNAVVVTTDTAAITTTTGADSNIDD